MTGRRILCVLALAGLAVCAAAQDGELDAVTKRLNALDSWLDDAGKRLAGEQRRLATAERRIAASGKRMRDLDQRIRTGAARIERLQGEGQALRAQRERLATRLAEHLRAAWRTAGQDPLKLLLVDADPIVVARLGRYHGYLAAARAEALRALGETASAAARNHDKRTGAQRELESARRAAAKEQSALLAQRKAQRRTVANLRAALADKGRERERLTRDQQRLQQLVVEIADRAKGEATPPPPALRASGGLVWPIQGRVTRRFGQARAGGRMRWQGIHLQAALGADVRCVSGGKVVFADWLRGFGMLLIVDHGGGRLSLYGHADALFKRVGERVEAGEVIAAAGSSGGQAETGLYFEVRQNGKPMDPLAWLRPVRG